MSDPLDRRSEDASPLLILVKQVHDDLQALNKTMANHIAQEPSERINAVRDAISDAFPGGDAKGHREAHEAQMQAVRDRAAFWAKMRFEITKYGLIGLIGWGMLALWLAFLKGPR